LLCVFMISFFSTMTTCARTQPQRHRNAPFP